MCQLCRSYFVEFQTLLDNCLHTLGVFDMIKLLAYIDGGWYQTQHIDIYRLLLKKEEFIPPDPQACHHCGPFLQH
jgi:hypothetical protein